ncbi:Histone H1 [hydrothermal vent metagenome]|uniref:Histone H1 n=1 Tax=hydrothermal vent metagenome TaxID=652676 RepID=A0A1W1BBV6_9ZZZZ
MLKKVIMGFLVLATSALFGMSLSKLNSASKAELMEINGIGDVKAAAIIKERRHGKFKSFEDVQRVEGIGEQTAANIKNDVKSAADVKKVKKTTKKRVSKKKKDVKEKAAKKRTSSKKDVKEKAEKKHKKTKSKAKKEKKEKAEKTTKKRKIKSMDDKKKELKKKTKKTKTKKTKAKKTKKTKSKKKN